MLTKEQIRPGMTIMYGDKETTVLQGSYEDEELGFMVKTSKWPGGYPLDKYNLPSQQLTVVKDEPQTQAIVFKGKIVGELEETIFTPEIIAEKSKPLLALKIKGAFDNKGAEEVKKAINKAVKMRTAVEAQADPLMKSINAKAKQAVQAVKDAAQPIYDACYATQNALQATYDAYLLEVQKEEKKLADEEKERTEGRNNALFGLGMTFNGQSFLGYGKVITQNSLHSLGAEAYADLLTELEALQIEQGFTGEVKAHPNVDTPVQHIPHTSSGGSGGGWPVMTKAKTFESDDEIKYENAIYDKEIPGGLRIVLTKGEIKDVDPNFVIANDRIAQSAIYLQVIDYTI